MNRKHASKVGKYISMACLLFVCTMVQSCRDEYYFDDKEPGWLGSSIYDHLESKGHFKYFLKVIDDCGYAPVLQKTGSKTLFVADDDAFMKGIKDEWGFDSYEQLSEAHKCIILYNAMLDNAYLLEMLSKWPSADAFAEPTAGRCLRLETSASVTDTIGLFYDKDLPQNNSAWDDFRVKGIRLALDATPSTMVFFTNEFLYQSNITNEDLSFILDEPTTSSDIYVFDKKVLKGTKEDPLSNVTCKNGYIHQLDGLLIPPSNMAEEIRTNGETNVFSRMLDRFAVPVPIAMNSEIAETYNRLYHPNEDGEQLYEKRYFTAESERGAQKKDGGFLSYEDINKEKHDAVGSLYYDPGWNAYQAGTSGTPKEQDMAAIFAPTDEALKDYFTEGKGKSLVERYADVSLTEIASDPKNLMRAIDSIPADILQALVRNLMQISFKSAVPSKFENILDDARESMHVTPDNVHKSLVANNGIVYLVDTVFSPARYVAVTAPVMLDDSLLIANRAIDDLDYDKYLLSMQNKFGLIVPTNDAMIFYDPYTSKGTEKRVAYKFVYIAKDDVVKVEKWNAYQPKTGEYGPLVAKMGDVDDAGKEKILKEMLEYYIVPDDMEEVEDCKKGRKYYMAKGYGTVKVGRDEQGRVNALAGGRELQNGTMIPLGRDPYYQTNGQTYCLNAGMIHPATQSVYDVLSTTGEFNAFFNLCRPEGMSAFFEFIKKYIKSEYKEDVMVEQFNIFDEKKNYNVRMFDTYHYTVYVPSNDAITLAHEQGLPTWEELKEEYLVVDQLEKDSLPKLANDSLAALKEEIAQRKEALKVGTDLILSFVKYHFQDNSVYVDNVPHVLEIEGQEPETEVVYETAALNAATNKFCSVLVKTDTEPTSGDETIAVRGDFGDDEDFNVCYVVKDDEATAAEEKKEHKLYNIMTRDIDYNGGEYVYTSSYAVVHQIHGGLGFLVNSVIYDAATNQFKK